MRLVGFVALTQLSAYTGSSLSHSVQEAANFFRKRAQLEEEYGRQNIRLARTSLDTYREGEGKAQ